MQNICIWLITLDIFMIDINIECFLNFINKNEMKQSLTRYTYKTIDIECQQYKRFLSNLLLIFLE